MYHDNPQANVFEVAQSQIIQHGSGLQIPIIGTRESVTNIDRNTLVNHYNTNYKNQLKIDVGGGVLEERIKLNFWIENLNKKKNHIQQQII